MLMPVTTEESYSHQIKTQEKEGGSEDMKFEADAYNEEASIVEACSIEKVTGTRPMSLKRRLRITT